MKNKGDSFLTFCFSLVMLLCVFFLIWYLPAMENRQFQQTDTQKSLETSLGRERKQQHEYDEVLASLPEIQAELDRVAPLAEAAEQKVKNLKTLRKELREEKQELEALLNSSDLQKEVPNE